MNRLNVSYAIDMHQSKSISVPEILILLRSLSELSSRCRMSASVIAVYQHELPLKRRRVGLRLCLSMRIFA
jgi:hypothetical protein